MSSNMQPLRTRLFGWLIGGLIALVLLAAIAILAIGFVIVLAPLVLFLLLPVGILLLILVAIFFVFRLGFQGWRWRWRGYYHYPPSYDSKEALRQRYARGEISKDQLDEGMRAINESYSNDKSKART